MSLKQILYNEIKSKNTLTLQDIYKICDVNGYKHDNSSRRLRELMATGSISPIKNSKGAIIGYAISNTSPQATQCDLSPVTEQKGINTQVGLFEVKLTPKSPYDY